MGLSNALLRGGAACLIGACVTVSPLAQVPASPSAAEIVIRNAQARGGSEAWKRLQTMAWTGHVEGAATAGRNMPFLLEQKRPNKTRFELITDGQRSIRVYDGVGGWKLRPGASSGRPELLPFTGEELRAARATAVINGPLMDLAAKGAIITLAGHDEAEGRHAYVLDVKPPSGGNHRIWVDAQSFLEVRHDWQARGGAGQLGNLSVLYRGYRDFDGVKLPTRIETGASVGVAANQLVIERVALNPDLDDRMFDRPPTPASRRNGVVVDARAAGAPHVAGPPAAP